MNHYLMVFNRSTGEILRRQRYGDRDDALKARFSEERKHHDEPGIEVVVLGAVSWDSLRRTHGRYFKNFDQLAADAKG
jgi:hypothetical protein